MKIGLALVVNALPLLVEALEREATAICTWPPEMLGIVFLMWGYDTFPVNAPALRLIHPA
ncbi:hypothetical protein [Xanthobacter variabilis]|uniref:hypothetical protein n=1 Tax=Xanthobacter variabilis TaxID=3119932 RepID=UPI00374FC774